MSSPEEQKDKARDVGSAATIAQNLERVDRYGSASAEYLKGLRGFDAETGRRFTGLEDISRHRVHPDYAEQNIKQQAGFSAEIHKVSRDNARNIIEGENRRTIRTDDVAAFGRNNPRFDHIELRDGVLIENSGSQMKFVEDPKRLADKIARGEGGGRNDLSRYQGAKLDLPSEQVELTKEHCRQRSQSLREQAANLEEKGMSEDAERYRRYADNYDKLENNCRDSGMTTEDAVFLREHPGMATAFEIAKTAHEAGKEGAVAGMAVGGAISAGFNLLAAYKGDIELDEAFCNVSCDVVKAGLAGYATTAAATAAKGWMQQSEKEIMRQLSKSALPGMIPSMAWEVCNTLKRLGCGETDIPGAIEELGQKGVTALAGVWGATFGQAMIPVPVVGALIGASISCALTSLCFTESIFAIRDAKAAQERYAVIKAQSRSLCRKYDQYRTELHDSFEAWFAELAQETDTALSMMENPESIDEFEQGANRLSNILNVELEYQSVADFKKVFATRKRRQHGYA